MNNYEIPKNLLQALYQYLMTKPMNEVENLVTGIRNCKPVDENKGNQNDNAIV